MKRLLLLYSLFSLAVIIFFVKKFHCSWTVVGGHMIFAILGHAVFIGLSYLLLSRLLNKRIFFVIYFFLYFSIWAFFYCLVFVSNSEWGDTVYWVMALKYVKSLPELLSSFQFSKGFLVLIALIYSTFVILLHYFIFTPIQSIPNQLKSFHHKRINKSWVKGILALSSVIVFAIAVLFSVLWAKRYFQFKGEPIIEFLGGYRSNILQDKAYGIDQVKFNKIEDAARSEFISNNNSCNHHNIIVILVDAMRADNLSAYGYPRETTPFLDSLIRNGKAMAVENMYSTTNATLGGVSSLFLSKSYKNIRPNAFGLPEAFSLLNYKVNVLVSSDHSGWYYLTENYKKYADFFYEGTMSKKFKLDDDRIIGEGLDKMPVNKEGQNNFFYFHLSSAHNTGLRLDEYRKNLPDVYNPVTDNEIFIKKVLNNRYDNRLLQADDIIKSILLQLDRKGYLKNSTVIITSDHGQSLHEGGRSGHVSYLHREGIRIPLIIIDDSLELYKNKKLARQIDVSPTIVQRIGMPVPATWQGKSLMNELVPTISIHENGGGDLKYHGFIENDSIGNIYRYLFSNDYKEEEFFQVNGNVETDMKTVNPAKLEFYRNFSRTKFDSIFSRPKR